MTIMERKSLTLDDFKAWAKDNASLAKAVLMAQAYAELTRERVDAYIRPIFDSYQFKEDCTFDGKHTPSGKLLESPKQLYLCDDPLIGAFYDDCDKAHREHGFKGPKGHCPALRAENLLMQAQQHLIDSGAELMGIDSHAVYGDDRKKLLKLLIGACLKETTP